LLVRSPRLRCDPISPPFSCAATNLDDNEDGEDEDEDEDEDDGDREDEYEYEYEYESHNLT
jgi:hypothetical protein